MKFKAISGGFYTNTGYNTYIINRDNLKGDKVYNVGVNNGTAFVTAFITAASNEQEAVDNVVDFCDENDIDLVFDHYTMADVADTGESVEEYAEADGFVIAGNKGFYIKVEFITEV